MVGGGPEGLSSDDIDVGRIIKLGFLQSSGRSICSMNGKFLEDPSWHDVLLFFLFIHPPATAWGH